MAISPERKEELQKKVEEKGNVSEDEMREKSVTYEANKSSDNPK